MSNYIHDNPTRGTHLKGLYRTDAKSIYGRSEAPIRLFIEKRAEQFDEIAIYNKIFNIEKTKNAIDRFTGMTAMEGFNVVNEGGIYSDDKYGYKESPYSTTFEPMTWRNQFVITQEMIEDSKLIDLEGKPASFVSGYHRTRERLAAASFGYAIRHIVDVTETEDPTKNPFNEFGGTFTTSCLDNKNLFSKEHNGIKGEGGMAQCNCFSDTFSTESFDSLESIMQDFRDENGHVLNICPDTLIIPNNPFLKRKIFEIIGADKSPYTANNGYNFQFGRWNIIIWQYLNQFLPKDATTTKPDPLQGVPYIMADSSFNKEYKGAVWMDRIPLTVKSDIDIKTDNCIWKGRARFTAGFHDWRAFAIGGINYSLDPVKPDERIKAMDMKNYSPELIK